MNEQPSRSIHRTSLTPARVLSILILASMYAACSSNPAEPSGQNGTPPGNQGGPPPVVLPDLVVSSVDLQTQTASIGQEVSYCFTIANIGAEGPAGNSAFDIAGAVSADATLDEADNRWSALYAASSYHLSAGFSVPVCLKQTWSASAGPPGTYYLIMLVDAYPNLPPNFYPGVQESNENNNWRASSTTITILP